nr:hypothetical protein [Streptomyces sp. NBRC 110028]
MLSNWPVQSVRPCSAPTLRTLVQRRNTRARSVLESRAYVPVVRTLRGSARHRLVPSSAARHTGPDPVVRTNPPATLVVAWSSRSTSWYVRP